MFLFGIATSNTVLMLGVFAALLAFSTNIARGPFQGYVPDLVQPTAGRPGQRDGRADADPRQRRRASSPSRIAVLLGPIELAIAAVALVELVTMAAVVLRVEPGQPPKDRGGRSWRSIAGETWGTDILQERSYVWLLASRFFFLMGGAMLVNLLLTYLKQTHGLDEDDVERASTSIVLVVVVVGNLVAIVPSARDSRTGSAASR